MKSKNRQSTNLIMAIVKKNAGILIIAACLMLLSTALGMITPLLIKQAIDVDIAKGDVSGLMKRSILFLCIVITMSAVTMLYIYFTEAFGQRFLYDLKMGLFNHILRLKLEVFDRTPVGKLIARTESDGESLREFFTQSVISIVSDVFLFIGMLAILMRYSVPLTLVIMPVIPILILFSFWYQHSVIPFWVALRKLNATLIGFFSDFIKGHKILKVFGREQWAFKKVNGTVTKRFEHVLRSEFLNIVYYNSIQVFEATALALILWFGLVRSSGTGLSVGTIILFVTYVKQFFGPIRNLSSQFQIFQRAVASLQRIDGVLRLEQETVNACGKSLPFTDSIVFRNVSFSYGAEQGEPEVGNHAAIRDVSCTIRKGEKVAIVGRTGSGKTTLASLLLRFYDGYHGNILVDGKELKSLEPHEVRSMIGAVFQDTFLFPDTILKNIVLDEDVPREKVQTAIDELGMTCYFARFPGGLDTEVKEDGTNLSSGEKQLIALLRVYLRNPQILLLDEATSSVDNATETTLYTALRTFMADRTAVIIAHRLSTVESCDSVLCFSDGELVESGRLDELLTRDGYFKKLYDMQFREAV